MFRRLREAKKKKRAKAMKLYVKKWEKLASEFDAEKFVAENLTKARAENWSVDPVKEWRKSTAAKETVTQ